MRIPAPSAATAISRGPSSAASEPRRALHPVRAGCGNRNGRDLRLAGRRSFKLPMLDPAAPRISKCSGCGSHAQGRVSFRDGDRARCDGCRRHRRCVPPGSRRDAVDLEFQRAQSACRARRHLPTCAAMPIWPAAWAVEVGSCSPTPGPRRSSFVAPAGASLNGCAGGELRVPQQIEYEFAGG